MKRIRVTALALIALPLLGSGSPAVTLVVCAPGYPGSTEQAQPTLDAFSAAAETAAGWPRGSLGAVYHSTAEAGVARLKQADAALALVPMAFYVEFGDELGLEPRLQAVPEAGANEIWALVAGRGAVNAPSSLGGWEITGRGGYAPGFVRNVVLAGWSELPETVRITFTSRALSALRRSAHGEKVAVLLDGEQAAALDALPFAADLEVVYRSGSLPRSILCEVGGRLDGDGGEALVRSLVRLHEDAGNVEILRELRLSRFEAAGAGILEALIAAKRQASGT